MIILKIQYVDTLPCITALLCISHSLLLLLPVPGVAFLFFLVFQEAAELLSRHPAPVNTWKSGCSSVRGQHMVDARLL